MMTFSVGTYLGVGVPIDGFSMGIYPDGTSVEIVNTTVDEPVPKTIYIYSFNDLHIISIVKKGITLIAKPEQFYPTMGTYDAFKIDDWKCGESLIFNLDHVYNGENLSFNCSIIPRVIIPNPKFIESIFTLSSSAKKVIAINTSANQTIDLELTNDNGGLLLDRLPCAMLASAEKVPIEKGFFPLDTEANGKRFRASIYSRSTAGITEDVDIILIMKA